MPYFPTKAVTKFYNVFIHLMHKNLNGHFEIFPNQLMGLKYICIDKGTTLGKGLILTAWKNYNKYRYQPSIEIGKDCHIGEFCHITAIDSIKIGNNVLTGRYVYISDNSHGNNTLSEESIPPIERQLFSKGPVVIGDNVWIGERVCILAGVTIGKGAIIGANAVVTHDVPPNCIAAGVPAKVIKKISS